MNVAVEHIATDQPPDDAKARDLDYGWQSGNRIELLENGEAYFPKVFEAMIECLGPHIPAGLREI